MVQTTTNSAGPFTGDGRTTVFPFTFPAGKAEYIKVYIDGSKQPAGEYTVSLSDSGGSATLAQPLATGRKLVILREVEITQETDLQNNGDFYAEVLENGYDKLTMICQQLQEQSDRSIKTLPTSDINPDELVEQLFQALEDAVAAAASAAASESAAASSATAAEASKNTAQTRAGDAFSSAASAAQSENNAAQSENNALASKNAAANSATAAAQSASSALESKNAAANSAIAAAASETNASASALSASASENAAANAADAAHDYAEQAKAVSGITEHNADENAHPAIRQSITALENGKLAISGGSMTGPVSFTGRGKIGSTGNGSAVDLMGGSDLASGGSVRVFGNDYVGSNAGGVALFVTNDDGTEKYVLRLQRHNGITWNNKKIPTRDKTLGSPDWNNAEDITADYLAEATPTSPYVIDRRGWLYIKPTGSTSDMRVCHRVTTTGYPEGFFPPEGIIIGGRLSSSQVIYGPFPVNGDVIPCPIAVNDNLTNFLPGTYTADTIKLKIFFIPEIQ